MMPTCTVAWPAAFVHSSFMALVDRGGECPWPSWVPSYHPIHHASYSASYLCTGRDLINFQYWFGQEVPLTGLLGSFGTLIFPITSKQNLLSYALVSFIHQFFQTSRRPLGTDEERSVINPVMSLVSHRDSARDSSFLFC